MPQVTLPVTGLAYNVNAGLGHDGITGVKTGSSSQAGGCLAFAAIRTVAGSQVMIVGVVLGVPATAAQPSERGGVRPRPLGHAITRGQPVAQATVTIGGEVRHITL